MEKAMEQLKKNRPNLSPTSLKTYASIILNLHKKMKGTGDVYDYLKSNVDKIVEHLQNENPNIRKTKMAVLISLLGNDVNTTKLKEIMLNDANQYNASLKNQQMNEKQKENWLTVDEIKEVYRKVYKKANPLLRQNSITKREYTDVLDLILLSLYTLIAPRRSQDFADMKIRNYDKDTDNYYDGKNFVFHKYKTAKNYGTQIIKVPPRLKTILNRWMNHNPHDHLLSSSHGNKISVSRMTLLLNKIFGKNVSTTLLRHIYISNIVLKDAPSIKEREEVATAMGHDIQTQEYYKKLPPK